MKEKEIKKFFDEMSINRTFKLESDPILNYEQAMRQQAVIELFNPTKGEKILDVGCGNARDILIFAKNGSICVGIDFSEGMIREGKKDIDGVGLKNIDLLIGSGTHLPFKNETFDKVSCSEIIEHIPNYENAVVEMKRVLKKHGKLVITTPNWHSLNGLLRILFGIVCFILRKKRRHPYDKWKTQREVINVLKKNNFKVDGKIGICFVPFVTYYFPKNLKRYVVRLVTPIEKKARYKLNKWGTGLE